MSSKQPVPVGGVWVRKAFGHLGGELEVLAEVDGQWCLLHTWTYDESPISHIIEPAGIRSAPADPLTAEVTTTAAAGAGAAGGTGQPSRQVGRREPVVRTALPFMGGASLVPRLKVSPDPAGNRAARRMARKLGIETLPVDEPGE